MAKRFLKGLALGGLVGGLLTWMHTTEKGAKTKEQLEAQLAVLWKKIQKEYKDLNPDGVRDVKKQMKKALVSWEKSAPSVEVKKALSSFFKKIS